MRTLVINLTRFGDLLQTQPVISSLAGRGDEVGLVCLENFASAAELLHGVDAVFPLPGSGILAGMDADWRKGLRRFWDWVRGEMAAFGAERVMNLTATLPSRILARHLESRGAQGRILGFGLDEFGFGTNSGPWASFLLASTRNRGCSPFNLVDLFRQAAELGEGPRELALKRPDALRCEAARGLLAGQAPPDARGFVALQLGASAEARRWPVGHFARLGAMLWERFSLCPVILGAGEESPLAARFKAMNLSPSVDLCGRTSLPELAAVLDQCGLLVTNDTGTMHLAAGLGVPMAALFLATAQPWDTGPYLPGSLCLEPDLDCHPCGFAKVCPNGVECRGRITPEEVFGYVSRRLESGSWGGPDSSSSKACRAWETVIGDDGFMNLVSLSGHEGQDRTQWIRQQRWFYRQFLDSGPIMPWPGPLPAMSPEAAARLSGLLRASERQLFLLGEQAAVLEQAPMASMKAKFMGNWQRLQAVWSDSGALDVLGTLWLEQSQQAGDSLADTARLVRRYHELVTVWAGCFEDLA